MKKLALVLLICCASGAWAGEVMTSARQIGIGRFSGVAFYAHDQEDINFGARAKQTLKTDALLGKLSVKADDHWHVFLEGGKIAADMENSAASYKRKDDYSGNLVGAGVKYNLFPDTIVTPAISLDLGIRKYRTDLTTATIAGQSAAGFQVDSLEYQAVLYISKKFFAFEPFGGLKVLHNSVEWTDKSAGAVDKKIKGSMTGVSPFLGMNFNFMPMVGITVEASFVKEEAVSAGITVGF